MYTAPTTTIVDAAHAKPAKACDHQGSVTDSLARLLDPVFEVPSTMVIALLTWRGISWREATERYFMTMNPWLSIVHPDLFVRKLGNLGPDDVPRDPQVALLVVCMQLVTEYGGETQDPTTPDMTKLPTYLAAKRILTMLRGLSPLSVVLLQCTLLLGFFEFGQGALLRAYVTIGDASTMVNAMDIRPGKYVETEKDDQVCLEDEERRCVYWGVFVMDRFVMNPISTGST